LKRVCRFALVALILLIGSAVASAGEKGANTPVTTKDLKAAQDQAKQGSDQAKQAGDTAWMLMATGLVLLMVPGLALFYGGMVRRKNVLGTMMHSMVALAIIGIQWILVGYSLAFGESQGGMIGWSTDLLGLQNVLTADGKAHRLFPGTNIPILLHCMFQGMFAIITPALISGALAERIRFGPYCLFILLWSTVVYAPLAHWVWAVDGDGKPAGWLAKMGAIDFAGGTVVHIAAGLSGLAAILVLRKRLGYPEHAIHPNSMVLTLLGAGLLWFGWFGFNGGSALASNGLAVSALTASQVAAAAAALSWMLAEWMHKGKPTALGLASGLVAGLVAVTPASGYVMPWQALVIGLVAGVICYGVVCLKPFFKYDDSLDAFGVHGVGGFLGAILTGVFATAAFWQAGAGGTDELGKLGDGLTKMGEGRGAQILVQLLAAVVAAGFAFGVSLILVKVIDVLCGGFCVSGREETEGLDRTAHGEVGFDLGPALELAPEHPPQEPRAASVPPDGLRRFTVVVEGVDSDRLIQAWSDLCQAGAVPPSQEFLTVYPYVTTVQGNRFRFRGGEPQRMRENMVQLFERAVGGKVRAYVDSVTDGSRNGSEGPAFQADRPGGDPSTK
jgi:ammonium transporter